MSNVAITETKQKQLLTYVISQVPNIKYPYFAHFSFFCCKIETAESGFFAYGCDCSIILLLRFKEINKCYCVQPTQVVKSKDACKRIKFLPR